MIFYIIRRFWPCLLMSLLLVAWHTVDAQSPAQPVTTTREYADTDGDGIVVSSGKFAELGPRGTSWIKKGPLSYWPVGYVEPIVNVRQMASPRITTPQVEGGSNAKAVRRTNLDQVRAMDAFVLATSSAVVIEDVRIGLSRYGVTLRAKDGSYGTVTGLTIRRAEIKASEAPVAIRGGSSDILVEDARLTCAGTSGGIPAAVKVGAKDSPPNHHITITRFAITGCASKDRDGYVQGDGIATERPDHHIAITHGTIDATGGDSGLDIKSSDTTIDDVTVTGGSYSARLRANGDVGTLTIDSPRKAAIQIDSTTRRTIKHLILTGSAPAEADIVVNSQGGTLDILRCTLPGGRALTTRIGKGTTVGRGVGC
jgi:hypothetical protein